MRSSHTDTSMLRLLPEFGLVDLADPTLGERLAETAARHSETFAGELRRGLLTASVAIGLDVSVSVLVEPSRLVMHAPRRSPRPSLSDDGGSVADAGRDGHAPRRSPRPSLSTLDLRPMTRSRQRRTHELHFVQDPMTTVVEQPEVDRPDEPARPITTVQSTREQHVEGADDDLAAAFGEQHR